MGEMHEVLLTDTLYINKNSRVTLIWHSAQMALELITWRPILAGDLKGSFERVGSVTLTGPDVKHFIEDIVKQEAGKVRHAA